jgi:hypothetical protein
MVSNNQRLEALELRPIPINGTQDEQSLTQEASMIGNELRYELLVANQEEQQQSVHTYVCCKIINIYHFFLHHYL